MSSTAARYAREWVAKAEEDYLSAQTLLRRRKRPVPNSICFHSHQCVEKYLKAVLVSRRKPAPKTHDLILLLELLTPLAPEYELIRDLLRDLNPYAVEIRYPGESATVAQAKRAVKAVTSVRTFIREKLRLR